MVIKQVLNGEIPIEDQHTGKVHTVKEACPTDIHRTYKTLVRERNTLVPRKVKPAVYSSFITMFRFAEKLGLVEQVGEEPMISPPPTGHLYTTRGDGRARAVISSRHLYRLTSIGKQDELSWSNLCQAYIQHWVAPQKLPEVAKVITRYRFSTVPSREQLMALLEHLKTMQQTKIDTKELDTLSAKVGDWAIYFEDRIKVSAEKMGYRRLLDGTSKLSEQLAKLDIQGAIDTLTDMVIHSTLTTHVGREEKPVAAFQPPEPEEEEQIDVEALKENLTNLMDEESKSTSIRKLSKALEKINTDKVEGVDEIKEAIEEYENITREGMTSEEYNDEKSSAFEAIGDAIDELALVEE